MHCTPVNPVFVGNDKVCINAHRSHDIRQERGIRGIVVITNHRWTDVQAAAGFSGRGTQIAH
jgi:hypothetical protein